MGIYLLFIFKNVNYYCTYYNCIKIIYVTYLHELEIYEYRVFKFKQRITIAYLEQSSVFWQWCCWLAICQHSCVQGSRESLFLDSIQQVIDQDSVKAKLCEKCHGYFDKDWIKSLNFFELYGHLKILIFSTQEPGISFNSSFCLRSVKYEYLFYVYQVTCLHLFVVQEIY